MVGHKDLQKSEFYNNKLIIRPALSLNLNYRPTGVVRWCCLPFIFSDASQVHVWGSDSESYRPNSVECVSEASDVWFM